MKQKLCRLILKMIGWKAVLKIKIPDKCVFCVAPHTSNTDFMIGKLVYCAIGGGRLSFLIKKEWFKFPFNMIFKGLGGIPVDRSSKNSLTDQIAGQFESRRRFKLAVTPEGTRKANPDWKKGFYYIAKKANVPILLAYIDYGTKIAGIERIFRLTGEDDKDIQEIKLYYKQFAGRRPERFAV
jgi:1-acyl-sn-glycerol-3-phosphate acyltransferase